MDNRVVVGFAALCACAHAGTSPSGRATSAAAISSAAELRGQGGPELRALLASPDPAVRVRAAIATGRVADAEAVPALAEMLRDVARGTAEREAAAWALGRVAAGESALVECVKTGCAGAVGAVRALGMGTAGNPEPGVEQEPGTGTGTGTEKEKEKAEATREGVLEVLAGALAGEPGMAKEAGVALGVLARGGRGTKGEPEEVGRVARERLVVALARPEVEVRAGAAYALGRIPPGGTSALRIGLAAALRDREATLRALAARAWGMQGLPARGLAAALRDADWRVRVEAARGLPTAAGAGAVLAAALPAAVADANRPEPLDARWAHALVALLEATAQAKVPLASVPAPETLGAPTSAAIVAVRCAAAQARDRIAGRLAETASCARELEPAWRSRRRAGAFAAAQASQPAGPAQVAGPASVAASGDAAKASFAAVARAALADPDARVRAAAAAEAGPPFSRELESLLADPDPLVVAAAAGALAKDAALAAAAFPAAAKAADRLAGARGKGAEDPASDAVAGLAELFGAAAASRRGEAAQALAKLLPARSPFVHRTAVAALRTMGERAAGAREPMTPVPASAEAGLPGAGPRPRFLSLITSAGELRVRLHVADGEAPLTSAALASLARRGFYDGLVFHRVVPDFVVQGGDPRGDGDGGPGWALPDEHTPLRFLRGTLGIATNGPGTGGSQFFLCHSAQPHLDGRYTVVGQLVSGEEALDALQPGDEILSATVE